MNLYLIRHTSVDLPPGICYGFTDVPVAQSYLVECRDIIRKIEGISFDAVYSSPLNRCAQLARTLISDNYRIIFDSRLKELNFGDWEGREWNSISDSSDALFFFINFQENRAPNGECFNDLKQRISDFIGDLSIHQNESNILIITHGGPIRAFYTLLKGYTQSEVFNLKVEYSEVFIIENGE